MSFGPCDTHFHPYLAHVLAMEKKNNKFYPIWLKFGTQFCHKKILSFWKFQIRKWLLSPITSKNVFFTKKFIPRRPYIRSTWNLVWRYRYYKYLWPKKFSKFLAPKLSRYSQLNIGVFRKKFISRHSYIRFPWNLEKWWILSKSTNKNFFRIFGAKFEFLERKN